jgi:tetratricopeptide (TPR) repeat protein
MLGCSSKHYEAETFVKKGIENIEIGKPDDAINDFNRAIELDPENADAYCNRGYAKSSKGDLDGAILDYSQALEIDPKNAWAYGNRGLARGDKGDFDGAIADDNQALSLRPNWPQVYNNRGREQARKGNLDEAISDYNQAITLNPEDAIAYENRGNAKSRKSDLNGAITDWTQAISLNPTNAITYNSRGFAEYQNGNVDASIADFDQAIKLDPNYARPYGNRGNAKFERGDLDGAVADFDQAIILPGTNDAGIFMDRGVVNYLDRHPQDALADFQKAAELKFTYSDYPRIYSWLVKSEEADQVVKADKELRDYLNIRQGQTNDWPVQVGHFLLDEMSHDDFLKAADSTDAKKSSEQHCEAYFYIAIKHLRAGNSASAKLSFQQCINTNVKTFYEYRMACIKLKQVETIIQ